MERLYNKLQEASVESQMAEEEGLESMTGDVLTGAEDSTITDSLTERLDTLDPKEMEFLAAHFTPNFAQAVGLLLGSEVVYQYLSERADPSKVLVPVPTEVAGQLAAQLGTTSEQASVQQEVPQGPAPEGAMADPSMMA